ncbi:MAG TPA: FtsX-like permease family protein, partial [Thermoanaerobaculia bacterium]|nr:FtsX-like permease family protein [Thermoanaerobaculia bacterium]
PVGRLVSVAGMMPGLPDFGEKSSHRIVGVVGDVRHRSVDVAPGNEVFLPYPRMPWSVFFVAVRTAGAPPLAVAEETRQAVWAIDPDLPIADLQPMTDRVAAQVAQPRFTSGLLTAFSLLAFLLAAMGVYGVVSYAASERTHEIGVRMSFGADRGDVSRLVLGSGLRLIAVGIALGLVAAFFATRLLSSLLFEVSAYDPLSFVTAVVALVAVSLVACWLPARRASRLDPREALLG